LIKTLKLASIIVLSLIVFTTAVHEAEAASENTFQEVKASEILSKIQNGKSVEYDHVIIRGDLDSSELDLPIKRVNRTTYESEASLFSEKSKTSKIFALKTINSFIRINDSIFEGFVNFTNTFLDNSIDLSGSNFTKNTEFKGTTFGKLADFSRAIFSENADFGEATFKGNSVVFVFDQDALYEGADFRNSTFHGYADFEGDAFGCAIFDGATFDKSTTFYETTFNGYASFYETTFRDYASFYKTKFSGTTIFYKAIISGANFDGATLGGTSSYANADFGVANDFSEAIFQGNSRFEGASFGEDAEFCRAVFKGDADFSKATFHGIANFKAANDFSDVIFQGNTDFSRAIFIGDADFSKAKFIGKNKFFAANDFSEATFQGDADFRESIFADDINFKGNIFNGYFLGWDGIKQTLSYDEAVYLKLIKNFKDHGQFDNSDDCYYQYRTEKMMISFKSNFSAFLCDFISLVTCGYGIRWTNTIICAIFIMFMFGLIFSKNFSWDLKEALSISAIVLLSLPLEWSSSKRIAYSNFIEDHIYSVTLLRLIGWSLLIILISTLSRIMIRY